MREQKTAVIGAGPCGLAACKTLAEYGLDFECLESSDELGGIWNIERGGGGYRSLKTNTSTGGMSYSDFPFPGGMPTYPNAQQMVDYFQRYADHFQLGDHLGLKAFPASPGVRIDNHTTADGLRWRGIPNNETVSTC